MDSCHEEVEFGCWEDLSVDEKRQVYVILSNASDYVQFPWSSQNRVSHANDSYCRSEQERDCHNAVHESIISQSITLDDLKDASACDNVQTRSCENSSESLQTPNMMSFAGAAQIA